MIYRGLRAQRSVLRKPLVERVTRSRFLGKLPRTLLLAHTQSNRPGSILNTSRLNELVDRTLEVEIDKQGWRGEGLVRCADGWISVRGVAPGEHVRIRTAATLARPGKLYARLLDVQMAASNRVDTGCANYPRCAGCHLRHVGRNTERSFKQDAIAEMVLKFTNFEATELPEVDWVASPQADGTRRRGTISGRWTEDGPEAGLKVPGEDAYISMTECPALTQGARAAVAEIEAAFETLKTVPDSVAWSCVGDARFAVVDEDRDLEQELASRGFSVFRDRGGAAPEHVAGAPSATHTLADDSIGVHEAPGAWSHATSAPAAALYAWFASILGTPKSMLDLGCGVGTLSVIAWQNGTRTIVGVDGSIVAGELCRRNAAAFDAKIEVQIGSFENRVTDLLAQKRRFECATINPMRRPVGPQVLNRLSPMIESEIIYLAPSPAAGCRDLEHLRTLGFDHVRALAAIDLHPQTYHVMLACVLQR